MDRVIEKRKDTELKEAVFVERLKGDFWSRAVYWVGPHISHLFSIPVLLKIELRNYKDIFLSLPRIWIQISFGELVKVSSHFTKWISGIGNHHVFNQALLLLDTRLWGYLNEWYHLWRQVGWTVINIADVGVTYGVDLWKNIEIGFYLFKKTD